MKTLQAIALVGALLGGAGSVWALLGETKSVREDVIRLQVEVLLLKERFNLSHPASAATAQPQPAPAQ